MNIAQANAIPLPEILKKIGSMPTTTRGNDLWYLSPFRDEKTASFHVNITKNVWYDHGEGTGGKVLGFVCTYLKHSGRSDEAKDALRWLRDAMPYDITQIKKEQIPMKKEEPALSIQQVKTIQYQPLVSYLKNRGIPLNLAKKYLKEVLIHNANTEKTFSALGLRNDEGGYELRNEFFKGSIAPKYTSFFRGTETSDDDVHVFEGGFDFLSAIQYQKGQAFEGDVIILNSVANLKRGIAYITNHTYKNIYTWFDNDPAGEKANAFFKCFADDKKMIHRPMNQMYSPHKDVNSWHMHKLGLKSLSPG